MVLVKTENKPGERFIAPVGGLMSESERRSKEMTIRAFYCYCDSNRIILKREAEREKDFVVLLSKV